MAVEKRRKKKWSSSVKEGKINGLDLKTPAEARLRLDHPSWRVMRGRRESFFEGLTSDRSIFALARIFAYGHVNFRSHDTYRKGGTVTRMWTREGTFFHVCARAFQNIRGKPLTKRGIDRYMYMRRIRWAAESCQKILDVERAAASVGSINRANAFLLVNDWPSGKRKAGFQVYLSFFFF